MADKLSLHNPLQRRIARHTNLATLFRQPAAAPGASPGPSPVVDGSASRRLTPSEPAPVKARLLPADSRLPQAYLLPRLPVAAESPAPQAEPPVQLAAPRSPTPAAIQTAAQPPAASRPEPPASPAQLPAAPPPAAQAEEDPNWRRLQTIYRRHQEHQQSEQAPDELPAAAEPLPAAEQPPADAGTQPAAQAVPEADFEPQETVRPAVPASLPQPAVQRQPGDEPAPPQELPSTEIPAGGQTPAAISEHSPEVQPAPGLPQKPPLEAVWPVQRTAREAASSTPGAPSGSEQPQAGPPAVEQRPDIPQPAATGLVESAASDRTLEHLQQVKTGRPSASSIEVLPPRRPNPNRLLSMQPPEASPPAGPQPPAGPERDPASADLTGQKPGSPPAEGKTLLQTQTEPAKPPPTPAGPGQPQPDGPRQVSTEIGPLPEDLWRLLGEEPPPALGDTLPAPIPAPAPHSPEQKPAAHPGETAQLTPAPKAPPAPTVPPVSTTPPVPAIPAEEAEPASPPGSRSPSLPGPEPAPGPRSDAPTGSLAVPQPPQGAAAIQRAIAAAESKPAGSEPQAGQPTPARPAEPEAMQDVLPPIQRREAPGSANLDRPASGTGQEAGPDQQPESELDLDDLARQVYGQLRRRLEIETERLHRRG